PAHDRSRPPFPTRRSSDLKALRRLFETEGYAVETQSDGRSALDSFLASAPAAVVLDLRLPKVSGRDVCKEIKAVAPTVPIVVLRDRKSTRLNSSHQIISYA